MTLVPPPGEKAWHIMESVRTFVLHRGGHVVEAKVKELSESQQARLAEMESGKI